MVIQTCDDRKAGLGFSFARVSLVQYDRYGGPDEDRAGTLQYV